MIPADVVSKVRLSNELTTQPVAPTQKLTDALSDFVPGQRVMATIQGLLPNGTYRAMIAQQQITLALPFAAKTGDALELEVVDSNGKLALAVVAGNKSQEVIDPDASVRTRLTMAGRLIAELLSGMDKEGGKRPQPAPLNNAQPVVEKFPGSAADLAPALKAALSKSGMFYEAHQARWLQGQLPTDTLLQEPQGKLSRLTAQATPDTPRAQLLPQNQTSLENLVRVIQGQVIAQELTPLVQQQLEALATHVYPWQGQVWPGQEMEWEIIEEGLDKEHPDDDIPVNWTTQLRIKLPNLGGLEATLRLQGSRDIEISLKTDQDATRQKLSAATGPLLLQFESSGLSLTSFSVANNVQPDP